MGSQNDSNSSLNEKIVSNNNEILLKLVSDLNNIIEDLTNNKKIDNIISQLKNIIIIINNIINDNKKLLEQVRQDIKDYHNDVNNRLEVMEHLILDMNNNNNNNNNKNMDKYNINSNNFNEIKDKIKDLPYLEKLKYILKVPNFEFKYRRLVSFLLKMNNLINKLNLKDGIEDKINDYIIELMDGKTKIVNSINSGRLKNDILMDISLGTIEDIEQILLKVINQNKNDNFKSYFESDKCLINHL